MYLFDDPPRPSRPKAGLGLVMIIMTMMMMRITTKIMMMTMLLVEMKKNRYDKNGDANEYYDVT